MTWFKKIFGWILFCFGTLFGAYALANVIYTGVGLKSLTELLFEIPVIGLLIWGGWRLSQKSRRLWWGLPFFVALGWLTFLVS